MKVPKRLMQLVLLVKNIELMLKYEDTPVLSYITSIYNRCDAPPFWTTIKGRSLESKMSVTAVVVAEAPGFEEFASATASAAVRYTYRGTTYSLPLPHIRMKVMEIINSEMDPILCPDDKFGHTDVLSILASGVITTLDIHYLSVPEEHNILQAVLENKMHFKSNFNNLPWVFKHSTSPLHILHGTVIFIEPVNFQNLKLKKIIVMTRSENQLVLFVNLLYDIMPIRSVIVPPGFTVTLKKLHKNELTMLEDEDEINVSLESDTDKRENIIQYGSALYEQMSTIARHLEKCMEEMSKANSKKTVQADVSMNIDVMVLGGATYRELWSTLKASMLLQNNLLNKLLS